MKKIFNIIYEHWLIAYSIFGVFIFSWLKIQVPLIANYNVSLWIVCITIVITILITIYIKTPKIKPIIFNVNKPNNIEKEYGVKNLYKVGWQVFMGYDNDFRDRRIWASGPYCLKCKYRLDNWEEKWLCVPCDEKYKIPYNIRICPTEKVIKIFEAKAQSTEGLNLE